MTPPSLPVATDTPPWHNTELSVDDRVTALLEAMTLEEKLAQLGSVWPGADLGGDSEAVENVAPMQDVFAQQTDLDEATRHGIGHLTRPFGSKPVDPVEGARALEDTQRKLAARSRFGVPAIVHEECLTGFTAYRASVFPASIAWAATFAPDLVERMAHAIGGGMRDVGVHQGLSPVLDVVRDYRWGRVEETLGEDPFLVSMIGAAYVRGLESAGVIATLKHFAGYSASRAARNHAPVSIGRRELADIILPPFEAAIREGGARSVMNSYSDIDGVPAGADASLLTTLLREEWGFEGTVVSDYWSIAFLKSMHRIAESNGDAGAAALRAGIDVELPDTLCYGPDLLEQIRSGQLPEHLLDRAARRVLRQKAELGLLDADWTPTPAAVRNGRIDLDPPANRQIARDLAERGIILLDNPDGALPLPASTRSVAVIGPNADDPQAFFGCYSFPNHILPRHPELPLGIEAPSLLEALRTELPDTTITTTPGCPIKDEDRSGLAEAAALARAADTVIAVVGDRAGLFGRGTSGEGCDVEDLALPGIQDDLVETLLATGTPVILIVVSGRPYALGRYTGRAAAIVQAFFPGEEGGPALAGVLTGRVNPSGKLPTQIPAGSGAQPGTYLHPLLGGNTQGISNLDPTPAFPFGHGLSYTHFTYSDLSLDHDRIPTDGHIDISCTVTNHGLRTGDEVVQLYIEDPVAEVTRPVRQLAGFTRTTLEPGQALRVTFHLHTDRLAFTGRDLRRVIEPGTINITVGGSSQDTHCQATFTLTGPPRYTDHTRALTTPVTQTVA